MSHRPFSRRFPLPRREDFVVVGAGQAGLAASWWLSRLLVPHAVLERSTVASSWSERRWDSFRLVTPNGMLRLPGAEYDGTDPGGFLDRAGVIRHLEDYARSFSAPVERGCEVRALRPADDGFRLETSRGIVQARCVIVATGTFHRRSAPPWASRLPRAVHTIGALEYRNPATLPDGGVLVVGSGQSGAQIAEELRAAGRRVLLATGRTPRLPRRHRGRDTMAWMVASGQFDETVDAHPLGEAVRRRANAHVAAGAAMDLRRLGAAGVTLLGRALGADGGRLFFDSDLESNLAAADEGAARQQARIDEWIARSGAAATGERETPFDWRPPAAPLRVDLPAEKIATVIWATGLRPDFGWIHAPIFAPTGYPFVRRGITAVPGLAFVGLHWMHRWSSGLFFGVGRDARHVVSHLLSTHHRGASRGCDDALRSEGVS